MPSSHIPFLRYDVRKGTTHEKSEFDKDATIPYAQMEALIALLHSRQLMVRFFKSQATHRLSSHIPVFIDRWRQSNDVEQLFSVIRAILGVLTCGKISSANPDQVLRAFIKYLAYQMV